jgi:hypothetical protein
MVKEINPLRQKHPRRRKHRGYPKKSILRVLKLLKSTDYS